MCQTFFFPCVVTAHQCDKGWVSFEKNCYYFSTSAVNLKEAMVSYIILSFEDLETDEFTLCFDENTHGVPKTIKVHS